MTCLKSVNGRICVKNGGCLISYSLQLVPVRKSDGATFILDYLFAKVANCHSGQIVFQTDVPDYDSRTHSSGPTKPKQKRHPLAVGYFQDLWPSLLEMFRTFPASTLSDCSDCDSRVLPKLNHPWNSSSSSLVLEIAVFELLLTCYLPDLVNWNNRWWLRWALIGKAVSHCGSKLTTVAVIRITLSHLQQTPWTGPQRASEFSAYSANFFPGESSCVTGASQDGLTG